ncbi:EamA family transporter RarD [Donghicola tyrosinivorans]|uniref:Chloramphenicol-sensitive protein RarD n=1 Tax=Donghicola tyrosinivorans TaxID=1652492 RepID=A0A2T0WU57_9RHOB|nr:EamA family transporter RarD [Donghicola tyrosinivorans]PRY90207.1 chloramphenicol-sensitive protein RarD [Donghicola tyrosinivorans]
MTETTRGVAAMIAACTVWGLSSLYYKMLADVPPITVLAHRTIWSAVFFALVLMVQGRFRVLMQALGQGRQVAHIGLAALMISTNWFFFIYSISVGHATQASLGYYIFPLVAVLLGFVFFKERLGLWQQIAVALAALAVTTLTIGLGVAPYISLVLAFSFGFYGVLKKSLSLGPVVSVTAEVTLLVPIAIVVLSIGGLHVTDPAHLALMIGSGPLTGLPLILFSYASRRIPMSTVGLLQYLNPTLQFLVATLVFQEPFGIWYAIAFAMIWTALAIYSTATLRAASRKKASA